MGLNLGSGNYNAPGWVNVDSYEGHTPDVVWDITTGLGFAVDSEYDQVYLGHVLEHLDVDAVLPLLGEVRRVLTPEGRVGVVGPDVGRTARNTPSRLREVLDGAGRWAGDEHRWACTGEAVYFALIAAGFTPTPVRLADMEGWPVVSRDDSWQFGVEATCASS